MSLACPALELNRNFQQLSAQVRAVQRGIKAFSVLVQPRFYGNGVTRPFLGFLEGQMRGVHILHSLLGQVGAGRYMHKGADSGFMPHIDAAFRKRAAFRLNFAIIGVKPDDKRQVGEVLGKIVKAVVRFHHLPPARNDGVQKGGMPVFFQGGEYLAPYSRQWPVKARPLLLSP